MRFRHASTATWVSATLTFLVVAACHDPREADTPTGDLPVLSGRQPNLVEVSPSGFVSPVRITSGKRGTFYVSDFVAQAIVEVEADAGGATMVTAFSVPGRPLGVAWTMGSRLLVGNASTRSVDVYRSSNGRWLYSLGGSGTISDPTDIAVDSQANLAFVLDGEAATVKVFALRDGRALHTISGPGPGEVFLQNPTGIAVDPDRLEVLVSDYGEPAQSSSPPGVKIYAYDGTHLKTISGKAGMIGQRFSRPQGLAVDGTGRILVVEAVAGEVLLLDRETGATLGTLGSFGSDPGQLWLPLDVVLDESQSVFVTNNRPRRLEVFSLGGPVQ